MRERWTPRDGTLTYGDKLVPGQVIALDVAGMRHKPWVIHDVRPRDEGRTSLILRSVGDQFDFAQHNQPISMGRHAYVWVLADHYSICNRCGDIQPCAEVWTERISDAVAERAARYEVAGVCPACETPVTRRQRAYHFEDNLFVPLGPPVTFHARHRCAVSAADYDRAVAAATGRDPRMSCEGLHTHHLDDFHECTNVTCPGTQWRHRTYARCYALSVKCNRPECWALSAAEIAG